MIRVLIVDDHALFRDGLRALFTAVGDIEVIGEAADGEAALAQAAALQPDVILMDIHMPGLNGLEAARRLLQPSAQPPLPTSPPIFNLQSPAASAQPAASGLQPQDSSFIPHTSSFPSIIMLTMAEEDASVFAAMRAGARGYVLKGARHTDILQAIRAVAGGQVVFGPGLAARMMTYFENLALGPRPPGPDPLPELSDREREVLRLMAGGANNKDIAERLFISGKTVSNHITNIFSKLQVADRAEAVRRAREAGLGG
jgi:DNA-binding NarL/FixJ family response regulator